MLTVFPPFLCHRRMSMQLLLLLDPFFPILVSLVSSPTGLIHTTDTTLQNLQKELEAFIPSLPPHLQFKDNDSDIFAGLLHLCHTCLGMMFWRVFARIQYTMPSHLEFAITVEAWTGLTIESAKAIEWLDRHDSLYDSWLVVAYSLTSCALVQVSITWEIYDSKERHIVDRVADFHNYPHEP